MQVKVVIGNQKSDFYLHNNPNRLIFDMEITMKNTRFEDSLAALAALPFPSPDPLLQNLVSHAPEVRMTVVAKAQLPQINAYIAQERAAVAARVHGSPA